MTDLLVLVPTRQRPNAVTAMANAFAATCTGDTKLVFCVDGDPDNSQAYWHLSNHARRSTYPNLHCYQSHQRRRLVGTLNHWAQLFTIEATQWSNTEDPYAVAYFGDDHRPETRGWDIAYLDALWDLQSGLVYGDDGLQGENLPTQVAMTADIIRALGYMVPPALVHMYCDNFWLDLGRGAECIRYLPAVHITHHHPATGKVAWDDSYRESNAAERYAEDRRAYDAYRAYGLDRDIARIRELRGTP